MKKILATLLAASLAFGTLAGCKKEKEETKEEGMVNLTMWTMWDGGDVAVAKKMVDEFNGTHPNIKIEFVQQSFDQYGTKLKSGVTAGNGPDIAIQYVGGFIDGMREDGLIESISDAAKKVGVKIDYAGYTQNAINANKVGDDYYAIPCDNLVRVLMYNKKLLAGTGLVDDKGNLNVGKSYEEFAAAMKKAEDKLGSNPLSLTMRPPQIVLQWLSLYSQLGGKDFADVKAKKVTLDKDKAVKALETLRAIYKDSVPDGLKPPADLDMFKSGKTAFYLDGAWNVSVAAQALGADFGVTRFPQFFENQNIITTNHAFILPKNKNGSEAKTKAAIEFIKWWGDNNWKWSEAGHLPAYIPATEKDSFKNMPYPKFYSETLKNAVPIFTIPGANLHQLPAAQEPLQKAMLGQTSCADAIDTFIKNINSYLNQ